MCRYPHRYFYGILVFLRYTGILTVCRFAGIKFFARYRYRYDKKPSFLRYIAQLYFIAGRQKIEEEIQLAKASMAKASM